MYTYIHTYIHVYMHRYSCRQHNTSSFSHYCTIIILIIIFIVPSTIQYLPSGYKIPAIGVRDLQDPLSLEEEEERGGKRRRIPATGVQDLEDTPSFLIYQPHRRLVLSPPFPPNVISALHAAFERKRLGLLPASVGIVHSLLRLAMFFSFYFVSSFFYFLFCCLRASAWCTSICASSSRQSCCKKTIYWFSSFFVFFSLFHTVLFTVVGTQHIKLKHIKLKHIGQSLLQGETFVPARHGAWPRCDARPAGGFARPTRRARGSDRREDWQKRKKRQKGKKRSQCLVHFTT
jgi:hypothetical protein